jgi:molybdopterin/thiamine biosynthesis adenylyltransferase
MNEQDRRHAIITTLLHHGFAQDSGTSVLSFTGELNVGHVKVPVEISFPSTYFSQLPKVRIKDQSKLPLTNMAHIEHLNNVCYASAGLLRLDPCNPGGSALRVLEEAKKAMETSLGGGLESEVALEFPRYWKGDQFHIHSRFPATTTEGTLVHPSEEDQRQHPYFISKKLLPKNTRSYSRSAFWIPVPHEITTKNGVTRPENLSELNLWWSGNGLREFFGWPKTLSELLENKTLIVSAPNAIVGVRLKLEPTIKTLFGNSGRKPFKVKYAEKHATEIEVERFTGIDCTLDYLGARNISRKSQAPLVGKRIAVIGCGTIGSHLARMLVQTGAGNGAELLVVDHDEVSSGNLGRHLLNSSYIGVNKAVALAQELRRFHPDIKVQGLGQRVENVWTRVSRSDLIIDATGVETLGEFLNLKALEQRNDSRAIPVLHSYIWHNGIAVQSFLNLGGDLACYRCLRPEENWICDPRKDTNSAAELVIARCGDGPYLPFSVSSSTAAAGLALETCLDFFQNSTPKTLRTRILDGNQCKNVNDRRLRKSTRCPACQD